MQDNSKYSLNHLWRHAKNRMPAWIISVILICWGNAVAFGQTSVSFDAATSGVATSGSTVTVAHTVSANLNRYMLVGVSTRARAITVPALGQETFNVTYGGDPLVYLGSQLTNTDAQTYLFGMVDPPTGTANVVVTFAGTLGGSNAGIVGVTTYSNVNQLNPVGPYASNTGNSLAPTLTVTGTTTNDRVLNVLAVGDEPTVISLNSGQSQRWLVIGNRPIGAGYGNLANASSTTWNYTLNPSRDWSLSGIAVKPVPVSNLGITKTVNNSAPYAGQTVTFTLTASNSGPDNAPTVIVNDLLPSGYSFTTATPSVGSYNGGTGVWDIGTLNSGASATLTISAVVLNSGTRLNTATISSDNVIDNVAGNNSASASVTLCIAGGTAPLFGNLP